MTIQIIPENRRPQPIRKPTMQDRFKNAFDVAVDVGTKTWLNKNENELQVEKLAQENEFARRKFNEDISGLTNPTAREKYFAERFRGEREQQGFSRKLQHQSEQAESERMQMAQSMQEAQQIYFDPNLTESEKRFGITQVLQRNPQLARNLSGGLRDDEGSRKAFEAKENESQANRQFTRGYRALQEGDSSTLNAVLEDPKTPRSVKHKLTDLREKQETRKGVQAKELRGRQSLVQQSYKQAVDNETKKLNDVYTPAKERPLIQKKIKKLEALKTADLKRLAKNPDAYTSLHIWNNLDAEFLPEEVGEQSFDSGQEATALLDSLTDSQVQELFKASGGDMERAKKLALERYGR